MKSNTKLDQERIKPMRTRFISVATAGLALSSVLIVAGSATAASPYDPNIARVANPANVCKSVPGTIEFAAGVLEMPTPDLSWFNYTDCVRTLAQGKVFIEPAEIFGDPYANCVAMDLPYPITLHSGESGPEEDFLLPDLTVKNHKQCGNALYAFHTITTVLFGSEEPPG